MPPAVQNLPTEVKKGPGRSRITARVPSLQLAGTSVPWIGGPETWLLDVPKGQHTRTANDDDRKEAPAGHPAGAPHRTAPRAIAAHDRGAGDDARAERLRHG